MNFDGNMGKVLIQDDLEIPRAISLDPLDGWMYWSDWGSSPRIERAGMDGTHRETIVSYDVKWPNGLTLDLVRKRVYWVPLDYHNCHHQCSSLLSSPTGRCQIKWNFLVQLRRNWPQRRPSLHRHTAPSLLDYHLRRLGVLDGLGQGGGVPG